MIENGVKIFCMYKPSTPMNALRSQNGQAAIFVALMFNVLFVFFAMAINVALVVHDKINLQNSTDMAAYYAAMKQAEVLNVIAHENYMIRQSYKLLAWRYRVLGIMGYYKAPTPKHPVWSGELGEVVYPPATRATVCITFRPTWLDAPENESLCNTENLRIPALPQVKVIAGFLGINHAIAQLSKQLRMQFNLQCDRFGAANWWFAASIMHAFRIDQRNRKQIIYALAKSLSKDSGDGDFLDLDGNSVLEGAKQTFVKNLTYANRLSFENGGGKFKMMNSMAGLDATSWLKEIKVSPAMLYTDVEDNEACNSIVRPASELPLRQVARDLLYAGTPAGFAVGNLPDWRVDSILSDSDFQFSLGVEKNPWHMAYVGINATTNPRQIFFPFGDGIKMVARAFAKPFGGRIGPWYMSRWQKGAETSEGELTDPLVAPRVGSGGSLTMSPNDPRRLPNYSRFPGDTLGLTTKLALNSLEGMKSVAIAFDYYKNIKEDMGALGSGNDILPWDFQNNKAPDIRNFEIAALAPDLFDITYYSIEPNFTKNYWERLNANKTAFQIPFDVPVRPDLGFSAAQNTYSVQEQMAGTPHSYQRPEAFYYIRQKAHLLTSWLAGPGAFNYDVDESMSNFGKCTLPDDQLKYPTPGSCAAGGGRTGYSVKLISRDALVSGQHKIGGPDAGPGAILNPPKANDGW